MSNNFAEQYEQELLLEKMLLENWSFAILQSAMSYVSTREISDWCRETVGTYPIGIRSPHAFMDNGEWYLNIFKIEDDHRCVVFFKKQEIMTLFAITYGHLIDRIKIFGE